MEEPWVLLLLLLLLLLQLLLMLLQLQLLQLLLLLNCLLLKYFHHLRQGTWRGASMKQVRNTGGNTNMAFSDRYEHPHLYTDIHRHNNAPQNTVIAPVADIRGVDEVIRENAVLLPRLALVLLLPLLLRHLYTLHLTQQILIIKLCPLHPCRTPRSRVALTTLTFTSFTSFLSGFIL